MVILHHLTSISIICSAILTDNFHTPAHILFILTVETPVSRCKMGVTVPDETILLLPRHRCRAVLVNSTIFCYFMAILSLSKE